MNGGSPKPYRTEDDANPAADKNTVGVGSDLILGIKQESSWLTRQIVKIGAQIEADGS
jgi:hypothetical protein